jgi:nucleoside phosphorylase
MIFCAGDIESFDFATPIGIGVVDSAINLSRICIMNPPEFILFIGSAGSYGNHKIFDIIQSKSATNIENSFFNANSFTPIDNMVSTSLDISKDIIINSSNYITRDLSLNKKYLDLNISLENMEYYSVIKVAKAFNIPVGGIFIVTNYCDFNAHQDFIKNHKEAMKKLSEYVKNNIRPQEREITKNLKD